MATVKKPSDHLAVRTVIGQGRKKAPTVPVTFDGVDYDLPGKSPGGFLVAAARCAADEVPEQRAGMVLLAAFVEYVVPKEMADHLKHQGDSDDINEIFQVWNEAIGAGESSGSSD